MNIQNIKPIKGYVITTQTKDEVATKSGLIVNENTDDFVVHAKVVISSSDLYPVDTDVVYHILDSESLRDGSDVYSLVHEDKVKGTYAGD